MKFRRYMRLKYFQVLRANGSVHEIALGVSVGCFIGLAVPTGLQLVMLAVTIPFIRFNKVMALSFIYLTSNFFTLPFVYAAQTRLGAWILQKNVSEEISLLYTSVKSEEWNLVSMRVLEVLDSFLLGGFIFGVVSAVGSYYCTHRMITNYRQRKYGKTIEC